MQKSTIKELATSFTSIIFLVIASSGVMMFFHFNSGLVKSLHEILGLVFVFAACLHVLVNWKSMKNYFSKKIFISAIIIITIVSAGFIMQSGSKGTNPKQVLIEKILNAPITNSFQLLNTDYEKSVKLLEDNNIKIEENKTISSIARANQTSPFKIVSILTTK